MSTKLPLEGVKILDLSRLLPGPWCSMILSDFGADVIKIEQPEIGDYSRWAPPYLGGESLYHLHINRNKKSIILNLKSDSGKEIFFKMVKDADVIIEAYSPGVADRMGIGYNDTAAINPGIIYCSITGFGQTGPYRDMAGHDANMVGVSGFHTLINKGQRPTIPGFQIADYAGAVMATIGIPLALIARERNGRGQYIDIAMLDGCISWLLPGIVSALAKGYGMSEEVAESMTSPFGLNPRYNIFETKDGKFVVLSCLEKHFWELFCRIVGREDLFNPDETPEDRLTSHGDKQEVLFQELREIFLTKTRQEWFEQMHQAGVPCCPVYEVEETLEDPHVLSRQMVFEMDHPRIGTIKQIGNPIKMSDTPAVPRSYPPSFGENTTEILRNLGYSDAEIGTLFSAGVVGGE